MTIYAYELHDYDKVHDPKKIKDIYDLLDAFSMGDWEEYDDDNDFAEEMRNREKDPRFVIIDTEKKTYSVSDVSIGVVFTDIPYGANVTAKKVKK
jgi:hypothetical protein